MTKRIQVEIRYFAKTGKLAAFLPGSVDPIEHYTHLSYGDTPAARAGTGDDAAEAIKSFSDATQLAIPAAFTMPDGSIVVSKVKDPTPTKTATMIGWATVPD